MSVRVWQGTDGSWSTAANWSDTAVPITGDDVIIPATSTQAITSGLSQAAVDLHSLTVEEGYSKNIGTSTTSLNIGVGNGTDPYVLHQGSGTLYLDLDSAGDITIDAPNWSNACTLDQTGASVFGSPITVLRGKLIAGSTVDGNDASGQLYVSYRNNIIGDAIVDWTGSDEPPQSIYMNGGTLYLKRGLGAGAPYIYMTDGRVVYDEDSIAGVTDIIMAGGVADIRGIGDTIYTLPVISNAFIGGGVLTLENDPRTKSIAQLLVMPGGLALIPSNVTVTSGGSMLTAPFVW